MPRRPRTEEQKAADAQRARDRRSEAPKGDLLTYLADQNAQLIALVRSLVLCATCTDVAQRRAGVASASRNGLGEPTEGVSLLSLSSKLSQDFCGFAEIEERSKTAISARDLRDKRDVASASVHRRVASVQAAPVDRNGKAEAPTSETRVLRSQPDTPLQDRQGPGSSGAREFELPEERGAMGGER